MPTPSPPLVWIPRVLLVLGPIILLIVLMIRRDWPALVGAGVFALLAEAALGAYDRFVLRGGPGFDDTRDVLCSLPMYTFGGAQSARSALVGFAVGYLGAAASATTHSSTGADLMLFLAALALLLLDSAMMLYLRCFSPLRAGLVTAAGVAAGAVFQSAVRGAAEQHKCRHIRHQG